MFGQRRWNGFADAESPNFVRFRHAQRYELLNRERTALACLLKDSFVFHSAPQTLHCIGVITATGMDPQDDGEDDPRWPRGK